MPLYRICEMVCAALLLAAALSAQTAPGLFLVSGNGQVVNEQFLTAQPLVVQARDNSGKPVAGVAVNWAITQGAGTIVRPFTATDANGLASANFLGTALQAGYSFEPATVTATSSGGTVNFVVTTSLVRLPNGGAAAPPLVELLSPVLGATLSGSAGSVLPGAIVVRVTAESGAQSGVPVPNVGILVADAANPGAPPLGACNGPGGVVLTDSTGVATCDLVLGPNTGSEQLTVSVGGFNNTRIFTLQVTPGIHCSYSLSPTSQVFGAAGGNGTLSITATAGCGWTATADASWIALGSTTAGNGAGSIAYTVAANTSAARSGAISVAGQTLTISQNAAGAANPLALTTTSLPNGFVGTAYSVGLSATGGTPPYAWMAKGAIPPGLTLGSSTGVISGTPSTASSYTFTVTLSDGAGASVSQSLTVTVSGPGSGGGSLAIVTTAFPNPVVGAAYRQTLTATGGCITPFSPSPAFSLAAGQLPPGITVQHAPNVGYALAGVPTTAGVFTFTLAVADACGKAATANVTLTVTSATTGGAALTVSPASLSFTAQAGGTAPSQAISVAASSGSVNFTATGTTSGAMNWLSVTGSATTPAQLVVTVNSSGLLPGVYSGAVNIVPMASNSPTVVPVTLTVLGALTASPASLSFNLKTSGGSTTAQQTVSVASSAAIQFSASAVGVSWLTVTPKVATAPASLTVTANAAGLAPGTYSGVLTIAPSSGAAQTVSVTLAVTVPPAIAASPGSLGFVYQQGANAPGPQTVALVNPNGNTIPFNVSTFSSGGNWLSVGSPSLTAPGNLTVAVNPAGLAAGTYVGTITVTPSDPTIVPVVIAVSLTVTAAPPLIAAITNAASFAPGAVAPGEIVVIFGTGFGPPALVPASVTAAGVLDTTLAATRVLFDNTAAPLVYAVSGQVSAIVPYEVAGNPSTAVQVEYMGARSPTVQLQVAPTAPALFTLGNSGQGAILNQDSSVNGPQNGAAPDSIVSLYATGAGVMNPASADGSITTPAVLPIPAAPVSVQIAGLPANVLYAGAAPGAPAGLLQVNVQVPDGTPRGQAVRVVLIIGQATSSAVVTLTVAP